MDKKIVDILKTKYKVNKITLNEEVLTNLSLFKDYCTYILRHEEQAFGLVQNDEHMFNMLLDYIKGNIKDEKVKLELDDSHYKIIKGVISNDISLVKDLVLEVITNDIRKNINYHIENYIGSLISDLSYGNIELGGFTILDYRTIVKDVREIISKELIIS